MSSAGGNAVSRSAAVAALVVAVALIVGGSTAATAVGAQRAAKPLSLRARVIQPGEFPGLKRGAKLLVAGSAASWARLVAEPVARVKRTGLLAVVAENLRAVTGTASGLSEVLRYRSAQDARRQLRTYPVWTRFAVAGVQGARGFGRVDANGGGYNAVFADGAFVYLLGIKFEMTSTGNPTKAELIAAVQR
ncbi:MAG: hypothetical protein ACRDLK_10990, partial [Gaiellaceae bacterium]